MLTSVDPVNAANAVTDGYRDQGLDAIYFNGAEKTLYVVQSKWSKQGVKTIEEGDTAKFLKGIQQLIRCDFAEFNDRIRNRQNELNAFLRRSDVRITLVVAFSSSQSLADPVQASVDQFLVQQNNVGEQEVFQS